jgi:hypothetical protein
MDNAAKLMIPDKIPVPAGQIDYKGFEAWMIKKHNWSPCPGTMVALVEYLKIEEKKDDSKA